MRSILRGVCGVLLFALTSSVGHAAEKEHRVAIQVNQNDPTVMNLALNNVANTIEFYKEKGETVQVEIVTFGPGLHMMRDDTSPVKDRIKQIIDLSFPSSVKLVACGNTKEGMEKREGKQLSMIPDTTVVPSGAVRLIELQEAGWSYLRP